MFMILKQIIYSFVFASVIFLIIDIVWLSNAVKSLYRPQLGSLLTEKPVMWAAILFYFIYTIGLTLLILRPAIINDSSFQALWTGIIFGIVAYGTYNLTNMATIKNWSPLIVFIDTSWGGFLTGISSFISVYLTKYIFS